MHLRRWAIVGLAALVCACDPGMLVGADLTGGPDATVGDSGGDVTMGPTDSGSAETSVAPGTDGSPIVFTTSFETGNFNDFGLGGADCYDGPGAAGSMNVVIGSSTAPNPGLAPPGPVHTGNYAAAFEIITSGGTAWSRCYLKDGLPNAAYYSAWFNILWNVTASTGWSLLHWQRSLGSDGGAVYLWDVSLINEPDGTLSPVVIDYATGKNYDGNQAIDAGTWFHLEAYLDVSDAGAFTMYLNDVPLVQLSGVSTDATSSFGFHVGNYAQSLTSQSSSPTADPVYVDDITVATQYVLNDGGLAP